MISLRRAKQRRHDRRRQREIWLTFYPRDRTGPFADGFGTLVGFSENHLPPGAGAARYPPYDAEIVTYVREGALAYEDSMGRAGVLSAGEFQRMSAGRSVHHRERNASEIHWAHFFQIWLRPLETGLDPGQEEQRFSAAQRRGLLRAVASTDARGGSLRIQQDALVFSALLDPGQQVVYELLQGRSAWLHLVLGEVTLGEVVLTTGDGAGLAAERAVSLTAVEETEILLIDLGGQQPAFGKHEGPQERRTMLRSSRRTVSTPRRKAPS